MAASNMYLHICLDITILRLVRQDTLIRPKFCNSYVGGESIGELCSGNEEISK